MFETLNILLQRDAPQAARPWALTLGGTQNQEFHTRMKYSNKTVAELCRALGAVVNTNAELDNLFLEFGLSYNQFGGGIQPHSNALVSTLCQQSDADDALTRVVEYVLERHY